MGFNEFPRQFRKNLYSNIGSMGEMFLDDEDLESNTNTWLEGFPDGEEFKGFNEKPYEYDYIWGDDELLDYDEEKIDEEDLQ